MHLLPEYNFLNQSAYLEYVRDTVAAAILVHNSDNDYEKEEDIVKASLDLADEFVTQLKARKDKKK